MLYFIHNPAFQQACRLLARRVAEFERSKARTGTPAFMDSSCVPRPEALANEVFQCVSRMELRHLNMTLLHDALQNNLRGDEWLNQFRKLFNVLSDLERLAAGQREG
jgi:hypothetical protein